MTALSSTILGSTGIYTYRLLSFVTFLFSLQAFTGYSMNGCLIHHTSEVRSLYPSDGGVIQVETYNLNHGKAKLGLYLFPIYKYMIHVAASRHPLMMAVIFGIPTIFCVMLP